MFLCNAVTRDGNPPNFWTGFGSYKNPSKKWRIPDPGFGCGLPTLAVTFTKGKVAFEEFRKGVSFKT